MQSNDDQSISINLPYEPGSSAELLFATHVFLVEVLSLDARPWTVGADGLEHRELTMELQLLQLFKGALDLEPGLTFRLTVDQERESEFFVTDYHGLWSHIEPEAHARYIVVAQGAVTEPDSLMQESHLDSLLDGSYKSDVHLALEAEQLYEETLQAELQEVEMAAVGALLSYTLEHRATARDVFGRYICARTESNFLNEPETILPTTLAIILDEDSTTELRSSLITCLYEALLIHEPTPDLFKPIIRDFFAILRQESAASIQNTLVEVQLYNLLFSEGNPRFSVQDIFPDLVEREILEDTLAQFDSDRAREILAWFESSN